MTGVVHGSHDPQVSNTTFLLVDSKVHFRDMLQTALLSAGAKSVKHASSVDKAIETLNRYGQEINCVFCDWDMPPPGGLELLRKIRARGLPKTSPRTPVVILTANAEAMAVKIAMALDVNGIALAPLSFDKLVKTASLALSRTWILRQPEHYLAVPSLEQKPVPEARVHVGKPPVPKPEGASAHSGPAASAAPRPSAHSSPPDRQRATDELKNVHMCNLAEVVPGQVLARDLRDREGHLLLSTGAVLKTSLIERLKDVADGHQDSYHIWVGDRETTTGKARL